MVDVGEPVPYMERTRQYYRALGYTKDYVWAKFDDVPFAPLRKGTIPIAYCADNDGESARLCRRPEPMVRPDHLAAAHTAHGGSRLG